MTSEEIRLKCLETAVTLCVNQITLPGTEKLEFTDPLILAKRFAGFVFGFDWDEDSGEYVEPEFDPNEDPDEDDSALKHSVRAFNDDGKEL